MRKRERRSLQEAEHTGGMIALYPSPADARKLAVKGGEEATDLHVTLAYFPDLARLDLEALARLLAGWAETCPPINAQISGTGTFTAGEEPVHYLSVDAPRLPAPRERLVALLDAAGMSPAKNHGLTPHITISYSDDVVPPDPQGHRLRFGAVTLVANDLRRAFPLRGVPISRALTEAAAALAESTGESRLLSDLADRRRRVRGRFAEETGPLGSAPRLPERPEGLFNLDREALRARYGDVDVRTVPLSSITPIRARPDGIRNAAVLMAKAMSGEGGRRDPITLVPDGPGYRVFDGNSTFAVLSDSGWSRVPAIIAADEAEARRIEAVAKALKAARKAAALREGEDLEEGLRDAALKLQALAKRRRRVKGRFADEDATGMKPGQSMQAGNVRMDRTVGGKIRVTDNAGKVIGSRPQDARDASARDDHPDAIGGGQFFPSEAAYRAAVQKRDDKVAKKHRPDELPPDLRRQLRGTFTEQEMSTLQGYQRESREEALFRQAAETLPVFREIVESAARNVGKPIVAPLKERERTAEKVAGKYAGDWTRIGDIVRGTVEVKSLPDLPGAVSAIRREARARGWQIVDPESKFVGEPGSPVNIGPPAEGYRDVKCSLVSPDGHVCEIQFNTSAMLRAKKEGGHDLYKQIRPLSIKDPSALSGEERARLRRLEEKSRRLYEQAMR